jgi:two-component system nitrogen regulation response regulator GlnG
MAYQDSLTLQDEGAGTVDMLPPLERVPLPARIKPLNGNAVPASLTLAGGSCVIGVGRDADLVLSDATVSRRHAKLWLVPEGIKVTDLGSCNGTYYLGQRLGELTIQLGSRIRVGAVELALDPSAAALDDLPRNRLEAYGPLHGISSKMRELFAVLQRLEASLVTVLIEGESGTGKELVARALHERSLVQRGPFVAVNCGALDRALVRSELFGYARGAFTGATEARAGAFEAAAHGTLLLDEIGELPLDVQPVLLRALENGAVARVGESQERGVRVRVVAATHRDLLQLVREGRFREDLYYRLAVVKLKLPPLRERSADIELLARQFAQDLGCTELPQHVLEELATRNWPGNLRELKNALRAFLAIGTLTPERREASPSPFAGAVTEYIDFERPYAELKEQLLEAFRRQYVEQLLNHTGGNQSAAARISGLERSYFSKIVRRASRGT